MFGVETLSLKLSKITALIIQVIPKNSKKLKGSFNTETPIKVATTGSIVVNIAALPASIKVRARV